jgi:RsiW-degrading membrane proteinase PrsW (M82 family)
MTPTLAGIGSSAEDEAKRAVGVADNMLVAMSSGGPSQPTPYTPPPAGQPQTPPAAPLPQNGQPPQGNPWPPQGQPGYPQGQPGYPQQGQPAYPQPGQPAYPQGQPGYPQQGQPAYPQQMQGFSQAQPGYPQQASPAPHPGYAPQQPGQPQQHGYPQQPAQQQQPAYQGAVPSQPPYSPPSQPYTAQQYAQSNYTPARFSQQPVYASMLAQPAHYSPPAPVAPSPAQGLPTLPVQGKNGRVALFVLFGFLGFLLLALIAYFSIFLGPSASVIGFVLALIPLTVVFLAVRMIDRWEPEPKLMVLFAIAWGAVAAVGLTLLLDLGLTFLVGLRSDAMSAVIQAPIVEEFWKGLGVFLIFLIARRHFDGPVDGIVYGALVGAGFAFTENIQYFAVSLIEGGGSQLTMTFFVRAVLSPFAHAMFTSLTGLAIGLAARKHANAGAALGLGALGLLGAIFLHALWNGSATFADFFLLYVILQVPLFVGFIIGVIALKREEARLTKSRLGDYAAAGWFTPEEVDMLATGNGRKVGLRWAAQLRGDRRPLMRSFIKDATTLAAVRQRAITGRDPLAAQDEQALLVRARATRAALLAY